MFLRDHFAFTRSERRAIIALLAVILVFAFLLAYKQKPSSAEEDLGNTSSPLQEKREPASEQQPAPFAFNPNTADSATLRAVGLSPFVSSNIVKYRRAGGHFHRPSDLARIYGMDSATFVRIQPYIYIPKEEQPLSTAKYNSRDSQPNPTNLPNISGASRKANETNPTNLPDPTSSPNPYKEYMENKLPAGIFLDLNQADSADLVRIPGIGSYYASQIVRLRQQLGGYVSLSQLSDIPNLPEIGDYVFIEEGAQQRINVNTASLRTLTRHPYIGYYRARAIVNLRQREGRVVSLRQLSFLDEFSDEDIQRLTPYLSFE